MLAQELCCPLLPTENAGSLAMKSDNVYKWMFSAAEYPYIEPSLLLHAWPLLSVIESNCTGVTKSLHIS